jgi:hypothetical protein
MFQVDGDSYEEHKLIANKNNSTYPLFFLSLNNFHNIPWLIFLKPSLKIKKIFDFPFRASVF